MDSSALTPEQDRKNGNLFMLAYGVSFFSAPVRYAEATQPALCRALGASATIANLPSSFYVFGSIAPLFVACLIPRKWEKRWIVLCGSLIAMSMALIAALLILPLGNEARIAAVVTQCLTMGLLNSSSMTFVLQCLSRGTTEAGRARALKLTFSITPIAAAVGSLIAQFVVGGGIPFLVFPRDYAILYMIGTPCAVLAVWCYSRFDLPEVADEVSSSFFAGLWASLQRYARSGVLIRLWCGYFLWWCALNSFSNLTLYLHHATGKEASKLSGLVVAIQFSSKALAGFLLGTLYARKGVKAPLVATVILLGLGVAWAWTVPGYAYLFAFALMGAGQLGGIYFPNFILSWSTPATRPRDIGVLALTAPCSSIAQPTYGYLADHYGFPASFALAIAVAVGGLLLVVGIKPGAIGPKRA